MTILLLWQRGATLATTLATMCNLFYVYIYYKNRRKVVWQEVKSSSFQRNEGIRAIIKNIMLVSVPISLSSLLSAASKNIDAFTVVRILKNIMSEGDATIQYGILSGKIDTLMNLPYALNIAFATALVPAVSSCIAMKKNKTAKKRIEFSILITILIGLPCTLIMFLFAKPILEILFPNASSGETLLSLSSFGIIFVVLTQTISGALQGLGKVSAPVWALGIGVIFKLIFNLMLIPIKEIGINGAVVSSIICHIVSCIICFLFLKDTIDIEFKLSRFILKPMIAMTNMGICSYYIYNTLILRDLIQKQLSFVIAIIVGMIIYVLSILILKILSEDEIFMLPYGEKLYKTLIKLRIYKSCESH